MRPARRCDRDGGGDGGVGEGGGEGGGGEGGGDGGSPLTSSAQQRTACCAAASSQLFCAMFPPTAARWCSRTTEWLHASHTHTISASCPQPLFLFTGSSASVHNRAPYAVQRATAPLHVAL